MWSGSVDSAFALGRPIVESRYRYPGRLTYLTGREHLPAVDGVVLHSDLWDGQQHSTFVRRRGTVPAVRAYFHIGSVGLATG
jgi:hypothetical protein